MKKLRSLTIFFPFFNEQENIKFLCEDAIFVSKKYAVDYEIILIDDGSCDNTKKIIKELVLKYDKVKAVFHEKNLGYGATLRSGFETARMDWVFYTDGDLQYNIKELGLFVNKLNQYDVVQGYKVKRNDSFVRFIIGKMYYYSVKILYGIKIKDVECAFRLIKRKYLEKGMLKIDSGFVCVELIKKLQKKNVKFIEVPVNHYKRKNGQSKCFSFKKIIEQFRDVVVNIGRI